MSLPPDLSSLDASSDPVCGELVSINSVHRVEYLGRDIYFCGEKCLALFMEDPDAYEGEGTLYLPGGTTYSTTPVRKVMPAPAVPPAQPAPVRQTAAPGRPAIKIDDPAPDPDQTLVDRPSLGAGQAKPPAAPAPAGASVPIGDDHPIAAKVKARAPRTSGPLGWLVDMLTRRRETKSISHASLEMMVIYRSITANNPSQARRESYRAMVMERLGTGADSADRMLSQAASSFATWPRPRALMLRDVIRFVAVVEYLDRHPDSAGLQVDAGRIISETVPSDL